MSEANYRKFKVLPSFTRAVWSDGKLANESDPMKWSGKNEPPAIGAKVKAFVNGLGTGTVLSYFVEYEWLGVLVQLDAPPEWYIKQNGANKPGHLFGIDLEPRNVK